MGHLNTSTYQYLSIRQMSPKGSHVRDFVMPAELLSLNITGRTIVLHKAGRTGRTIQSTICRQKPAIRPAELPAVHYSGRMIHSTIMQAECSL
jgi:hypothetical protein